MNDVRNMVVNFNSGLVRFFNYTEHEFYRILHKRKNRYYFTHLNVKYYLDDIDYRTVKTHK